MAGVSGMTLLYVIAAVGLAALVTLAYFVYLLSRGE